MTQVKRRLHQAAAALTPKRWAHLPRFGSPPPPLDQLPPGHEQLINEWVERAHPYTTVEANGEPEGFVGLCPPVSGAITFADTEQEAIDDMRSCLFGWACFSLGDGQGLPTLPGDTATR